MFSRATGLRQREEHLVPELLLLEPPVERPQERFVLLAAALADPEDRLLPQVRGQVRDARRRRGAPAWPAALPCCDSANIGLLLQRPILRGPEDRVERADRSIGAHLRQPEHRLLPHFGSGSLRADSSRMSSVPAALSWAMRKTAFRRRHTEPASRRASTCWRIGRARASSICMQRVERRELGVVIFVGSTDRHRRRARGGAEESAAPVRSEGPAEPAARTASSAAESRSRRRAGRPAGELALDAASSAFASPRWPPGGSGRAAYRAPAAPSRAAPCLPGGKGRTRASSRRRRHSPTAGTRWDLGEEIGGAAIVAPVERLACGAV